MKPLEKTTRYLEKLHDRRITEQYDAIIPVIGDEGVGKSTFMTILTGMWRDVRGRSNEPDDILGRFVWGGRDEFKQALVNSERQSVITVQDAVRVLYKKEAMVGDQREIEKDLLDVRTKEFVILLGFQDWDVIPSMLQNRRAYNAFYIPRRGAVEGFSRDDLDQWAASGERPEPSFADRFPSLEGTETWREFQARDREEKDSRIGGDTSIDPETTARREQIKTALRAVKPWSEGGMTYREAAKLTDYSRTWVSERVTEWKEGNHRDLVGESDAQGSVIA